MTTNTFPGIRELVVCPTATCPQVGNPALPDLVTCPACHAPTVRYVDTLPAPVPAIVCPSWCTTDHVLGWDADTDGTPTTNHCNADLGETIVCAGGDTFHVDVWAGQYGTDGPGPLRVNVSGEGDMTPAEARTLAQAVLTAAAWVEANQ